MLQSNVCLQCKIARWGFRTKICEKAARHRSPQAWVVKAWKLLGQGGVHRCRGRPLPGFDVMAGGRVGRNPPLVQEGDPYLNSGAVWVGVKMSKCKKKSVCPPLLDQGGPDPPTYPQRIKFLTLIIFCAGNPVHSPHIEPWPQLLALCAMGCSFCTSQIRNGS